MAPDQKTISTNTPLVQPWKRQWPPQSQVSVGEAHGVDKGDVLLHEGSSSAAARYPRELDEDK